MNKILYKCIDISKYQGDVNFAKVKQSGVNCVIIRLGYGLQIDPNAKTNILKAKLQGFHIGGYWASYSTSIANAHQEAVKCLTFIKQFPNTFDLPIFYDYEDFSLNYFTKINKRKPTKTEISNMIEKFSSTLEIQNYFVGLYANVNYFTNYIHKSTLNKYTLWCACWSKELKFNHKNVGVWQYGGETNLIESKFINGVSGIVDKDYIFFDYPNIIKNKKLNGWC